MAEFDRSDVDIVHEEYAYQGFYTLRKTQLRHRLYQGGWSKVLHRELVVRIPAVAVLLYDPAQDMVVLIEQFRVGAMDHPQGPWQLEMVAGLIDTNESPEQVAVRECYEEAGLEVDPAALHKVFDYLVTPGGSNESLTIYCAQIDSCDAGGIYGLPTEGEDIRVCPLPREELWQRLEAGKITNAATLIALQWLQMNYPMLQSALPSTSQNMSPKKPSA